MTWRKWKNSWRKGFWWRASITPMSFLSLGSPCLRKVSPWWFYLIWSTEISDILSVQSRGYVVPDLGILFWATLSASHFPVPESSLGLELLVSSLQNEIVLKKSLPRDEEFSPFLSLSVVECFCFICDILTHVLLQTLQSFLVNQCRLCTFFLLKTTMLVQRVGLPVGCSRP